MEHRPVISFDFHNTLAQCDEWFDLEVRNLVPAFLNWRADNGRRDAPTQATVNQAVRLYRACRTDVMESGIEQDAHSCVLRVCEQLGIDATSDEIARGLAEIMHQAHETATDLPGAVRAVKLLRSRGHRLAVISSAIYHPFLDWTLKEFGIEDEFEVVITSASCGWYKSSPRIYEHALDTLQIKASNMIHVGDSFRFDVIPAAAIGISPILVDWSGLAEHREPALATIQHLSQLSGLIPDAAREPVSCE